MLVDHIGISQLRDLAKRSEEIAGEIRLNDLPRLKEILYSDDTTSDLCVDVRVRFHNGIQGFPEISGTVSGLLKLQCQRCLGALDWPLNLEFLLAVVGSEADIEEVSEPFDTLVAGEYGIGLAEVVEDEVLSSLPLAPVHENVKDCQDGDMLGTKLVYEQDDVVEDAEHLAGKTNQPFAGLADLLRHSGNKTD